MKLKILNGILIVDILSVLLILSIVFIPSAAARVILELPFLLFFPGYTLVAALFVKKEGTDNIERVVLSCCMSMIVVALIGFGLNYTPWGIRLEPVLYSISAFIFAMSIIALVRRHRTSNINKFATEFALSLPGWEGSTLNKVFSIVLIILIFSALMALGYKIVVPKIGERFTEFYVLGIHGKAQDFPIEYVMNEGRTTQVIYSDGTVDTISGLGTVTLGISNHEQQAVVYSVKIIVHDNDEPANISFGGTIIDALGPIELKNGEKWEKQIGIAPRRAGANQKVEFLLYKDLETTSENSLHLWINAKQGE